jgi:hypothetical protein
MPGLQRALSCGYEHIHEGNLPQDRMMYKDTNIFDGYWKAESKDEGRCSEEIDDNI